MNTVDVQKTNLNESQDKVELSIIIPVYNEEGNIDRFENELIEPLLSFGKSFEVIAVDDGSKDSSWNKLEALANKYTNFKALKHSRNYGMGAAYQSAINESRGDKIITFSSDLEIPAKSINDVANKLDEGFDVVNTHRTGRWSENAKSSLLRKLPSTIANGIIQKIAGIKIKDTGSGLKGFKSYIIKNFQIYGDMHRFLLAYSTLYTKRITEIDVEYKDREFGQSAYGSIFRTFSVFLDLFALYFLLRFSTKPFTMMPGRSFGSLGIMSFILGLAINIYLLVLKFIYYENIGERPLFIVGVLMIILGVQLLMTGLLGELMMRTYFESQNKTPYLVVKKVN